MIIRLLLLTKAFLCTLLDHFSSIVVHDVFSFQCEVLANEPHLHHVRTGYFFCLISYCACAKTATVVLLDIVSAHIVQN